MIPAPGGPEGFMKFVCLGYQEEAGRESLSRAERSARMEECLAFDDELRRGGHLLDSTFLQDARHAVTLRQRGGQVDLSDGPCAGSGRCLDAIWILEARDLNHAIQMVSRHPGLRRGAFEIHAVASQRTARPGNSPFPETRTILINQPTLPHAENPDEPCRRA